MSSLPCSNDIFLWFPSCVCQSQDKYKVRNKEILLSICRKMGMLREHWDCGVSNWGGVELNPGSTVLGSPSQHPGTQYRSSPDTWVSYDATLPTHLNMLLNC